MGGGTLSGKVYDKKACYLKVLEVDDKHANAWSSLVAVGGDTVSCKSYDQKACDLKALEMDDKHAIA